MDIHDAEKRLVVVNMDDIRNIEEFFTHFEIPMDAGLVAVSAKFRDDPTNFTFEDQALLRTYVAKSIAASDHKLLTNDIFKDIVSNCKTAAFDGQFELDLQSMLTEEDKSKAE